MHHTFDLTDNGMRKFGFFPEAIAALTIPMEHPNILSVLVWGVIFREPELDATFCQLLHPMFVPHCRTTSTSLGGVCSGS